MSYPLLKIVDSRESWGHLQVQYEELSEAEYKRAMGCRLELLRYCLRTFQMEFVVGKLFFQGDTPAEYFKGEGYTHHHFPLGINEGWFHEGNSFLLSRPIDDDSELELAIDSGCVFGFSSSNQMDIQVDIMPGWKGLANHSTKNTFPLIVAMKGLQALAAFGHDGMRFDFYLRNDSLPLMDEWRAQ